VKKKHPDLFSAWDWFFIVSPEFLIELESFFLRLLIIGFSTLGY
jgi:hypothetical protein